MIAIGTRTRLPSSFRDPGGFLFSEGGAVYRQVNPPYKDHYDHLMRSGLYRALTDRQLLLCHEEVERGPGDTDGAYKILKPEPVPFVSYPYEWCFSQLKRAALATLDIQRIALDFGMTLKDASAYNVQFRHGRPLLIDTLSFAMYRDGAPWVAYRQFCQHFLAPLVLMSCADVRLHQLSRAFLDGIPLDLASRLLPLRARCRFSVLSHVYLHAKFQQQFAETRHRTSGPMPRVSLRSLRALIDHLTSSVNALAWHPHQAAASPTAEVHSYSPQALQHKRRVVAELLERLRPKTVWDLGASTGFFSRLASQVGAEVIAVDRDPAAVEHVYQECSSAACPDVLPLVVDVANPSPGIGWDNRERASFLERGPADTVLALALIHHLAISDGVPLSHVAQLLYRASRQSLLVECVPGSDPTVQQLLSARPDGPTDYTEGEFQRIFQRYFTIETTVRLTDSERTLYMMERRQTPG